MPFDADAFALWLPYGLTCARRAARVRDADELHSAVALVLWRAFSAVALDERGPRRLVAFVASRAARQVAASERRRDARFRQAAAVCDEHGDAADALSLIPSRDPDPGEAAALADALAALPADVRADAVRHYLDCEPWRMIGADRGVSGQAVHQRVAHAMERMRPALAAGN